MKVSRIKNIRSIRFKLALLLVSSALIGVLLSSSGTFFYITGQIKKDGLNSLVEVAKMMSNTVVAALEFEDMDSIRATLNSVNQNENIQAIFLYDGNQNLLTTYKKAGDNNFDAYANIVQSEDNIHDLTKPFENEGSEVMLVGRPIYSSGEFIGALTIVGNANLLQKATQALLFVQFLVATLAIVLVFLLALRMQHIFTRPIFKLTEAMQRFSSHPDRDDDITHESQDEFQTLFEGYNFMLEVIRKRNRELDFQRMALDEHAIVTTLDKHGMITHLNDKFCRISGYQRDDLMGTDHRLILSNAHPESFYEDIYKTIKSGSIWQGELNNKTKDGHHYWVAATIVPFLDDQGIPFKYIAVRTDITEQKQAEETMRQAREMAEHATQAKSDFLSTMSHEIRTPMNAVIGLTHLVLDTELSRHQRDYLQKSHAAAKNLLGIINDILDFSKIEAGKLEMESVEFDMQEVLDNLAQIVSVKTAEKKLDFLVDIKPGVARMYIGDSLRIGQVLINLVNNAVKFTETGSITAVIKHEGNIDGRALLRFEIHDTGIGMTEEQCGRLFKAFAQADSSTTRKFGGTGLGLVISKSLVEKMDGEIGVFSEPGKGSCFHFTCLLPPGDESHASQTHAPVSLQHLKTLIVDDNPDALIIMQRQLKSLEMDATTCSSGEEALARVLADPDAYDLVFMDWQMPGLNGIETSKQMRSKLSAEQAPKVILASAYSDAGSDADEMLANGIDGFISKPVNNSTLLDAVMDVMGHQVHASRRDGANQAYDVPEHIIGAHLLLAEDNDINQIVATGILEKAHMRVTIANNGQEAVDAVQKEQFDGVLMDIQMPVLNGYDATAAIRENPKFSDLPILAMTANAMQGDRERCIEAGMNDHISKPIDPDVLIQTIAKWVTNSQPAVQINTGLSAPSIPSVEPDAVPLAQQVLAGIDVRDGLNRLGGDEKLYRRILDKFMQGQRDALHRVRDAMNQDDRDTAQREAHTLKGVAGNMGATELCDITESLEVAIDQGKELDESLMAEVDIQLQIVLKSIEDLFNNAAGAEGSAAAGEIDWQAVIQQVSRLKAMLEDDDTEAIDLMDELQETSAQAFKELALGGVRRSVEEYDFEAALEQYATVQEKLEKILA